MDVDSKLQTEVIKREERKYENNRLKGKGRIQKNTKKNTRDNFVSLIPKFWKSIKYPPGLGDGSCIAQNNDYYLK